MAKQIIITVSEKDFEQAQAEIKSALDYEDISYIEEIKENKYTLMEYAIKKGNIY